MVPVSAIIAFLLLGIEEIGVQIEEPFGILPLGQEACLLYFDPALRGCLSYVCFTHGMWCWLELQWNIMARCNWLLL